MKNYSITNLTHALITTSLLFIFVLNTIPTQAQATSMELITGEMHLINLFDKSVPTEVVKATQIKSVLIINDDNDIYFGDDQSVPTFASAFKDMGYDIKLEKASETVYTTWKRYDIVVWSSGDDYFAIDDIKNKQMLIDYVSKGGRLLLESGNIAAMIKEFGGETVLNRTIREKVLHATTDWVYHDVGDLKLKTKHPIATTPNVLPETINFIPTDPGDDSGDANAVRILPNATCIYGWSYLAYEGKLVNDSLANKSCGLIAYDAKWGRIIYYAHDIDDIDSPDIQQKLIQNSENWLRR